MGQLVIVVLSIVLMSLVVAGGVSYLHTDMGVRTETAQRVTAGVRSLETAFASYRMANRGALPTPTPAGGPANTIWFEEIDPYLPSARPFAPSDMEWIYTRSKNDGVVTRTLCLTTKPGAKISKAVHEGLVVTAKSEDNAFVAASCDAETEDLEYGASTALIIDLRLEK